MNITREGRATARLKSCSPFISNISHLPTKRCRRIRDYGFDLQSPLVFWIRRFSLESFVGGNKTITSKHYSFQQTFLATIRSTYGKTSVFKKPTWFHGIYMTYDLRYDWHNTNKWNANKTLKRRSSVNDRLLRIPCCTVALQCELFRRL